VRENEARAAVWGGPAQDAVTDGLLIRLHMGRPPAQQKEAIRRRAQAATLEELVHSYNVSRAMISPLGTGLYRNS
jgi:hypothetical protein